MVGSFTATQTQFQAGKGIKDSVEAHEEDAGQFAPTEIEKRNNHSWRRHFLSHAAKTIEWLTEMGIQFRREMCGRKPN